MAATEQRTYTDAATGIEYPLHEADVDYTFPVYKSDRRKAVIGDPTSCLIALGIKHDKEVVTAFIGSGKDAFVVFKGKGRLKAYAMHYVILAQAAKIRDTFDQKGAPATQYLTLTAPTAGRTLDARSKLNKRRYQQVKNGAPVKSRGKPNTPRVVRLGVAHRPRAVIRQGSWTVPEIHAAP